MNKFILFSIFSVLSIFACSSSTPLEPGVKLGFLLSVDSLNLKKDVAFLSEINPARNYKNPEILDSVADYIFNVLNKNADTVYFQNFEVNGINYKNVIAKYGIQHSKKIIIGAHYDSCHDLPGADDNASGVAGLLEIGRKIPKENLKHQVELVAYTLEEPPFFRTKEMGSSIHAESVDKKNVLGMICLEMIGYYSNKPNSQDYPIEEMKLQYPTTGNFIAVIGNLNQTAFASSITKAVTTKCKINVVSFNGPPEMEGIDFSDHLNYWKNNMNAVMVTNTAFYRNKNYHTELDIKEALNYSYMAWVVEGVLNAACTYNE
jgi:Zn-dependent M28 family amino/carboxypeptidase